jgi:hypothetical protein
MMRYSAGAGSPGTHLLRQAEALRVEAAHDGPVSLRDAGPKRRRVDAYWRKAVPEQGDSQAFPGVKALPRSGTLSRPHISQNR